MDLSLSPTTSLYHLSSIRSLLQCAFLLVKRATFFIRLHIIIKYYIISHHFVHIYPPLFLVKSSTIIFLAHAVTQCFFSPCCHVGSSTHYSALYGSVIYCLDICHFPVLFIFPCAASSTCSSPSLFRVPVLPI